MPNPYSYGPLVIDPAMFFGRETELSTLRTRLRNMQSTSVVGLRRIGKSSLLYQLARTLRDHVGQNYVPLYIDLHDARYRSVQDFVITVVKTLNEQMGGILVVNGVTDMSRFAEMLDRLWHNGTRPVLCLDEFEEFMQHPEEFNDDFFEALRALGSQSRLAMVTASRTPLAELMEEGQLTSPFFNIFSEVELNLLSADAAKALRREPFGRKGKSLSPEDEELVKELGGRHPFFLQMACYHLYEALPQPVERRAIFVRERFMHDAEPQFERLLDHLSAGEKAALKVVVGQAVPTNDTQRVIKSLARLGAMEEGQGEWKLFSATFAGYVQQYTIELDQVNVPEPEEKLEEPSIPLITRVILFAGVAVIVVILAAVISLLLADQIQNIIMVSSLILLFVLVGIGKLTGYDFLKWLGRLLGLGA